MARQKDTKRRRESLWNDNKHCHWCGVETVWAANNDGKNPDNSATLDHIYSRYHPKRREPNKDCERRYVLACQACNHERGRLEDMENNPKPKGYWKNRKNSICTSNFQIQDELTIGCQRAIDHHGKHRFKGIMASTDSSVMALPQKFWVYWVNENAVKKDES